MAAFDKACVDVAELEEGELARVCRELGLSGPARKLSNGGCAANYRVGAVVVKAVVGPECRELATNQLRVLQLAAARGAGPGAASANAVDCVTTAGLKACAIAMDLVPGTPLNVLVRDNTLDPATGYGAIGTALGRLHAGTGGDAAAVTSSDIADPRFLERFLRIDGSVQDELAPFVATDAFAAWVAHDDWARLRAARTALAGAGNKGQDDDQKDSCAALPCGLLHGDPYSDNAIAETVVDDDDDDDNTRQDAAADGDKDKPSTTRRRVASIKLIDWEDACVGPLCYDLGAALVATVFDQDGSFRPAVATSLLATYARARPDFSEPEARALPDMMAANALACGLYRWHQFHVVNPDVPPAAKQAHAEMQAAVTALEDPALRSELLSLTLSAAGLAPAVG